MAEKDVALRIQRVEQVGDHGAPRLVIEVDQNIPAKNKIVAAHSFHLLRIVEIELFRVHQARCVRMNHALKPVTDGTRCAAVGVWYSFDGTIAIDSIPGELQHVLVNIGGGDPDVPVFGIEEILRMTMMASV